MRIFKTKDFHKWAKKINLLDQNLKQAIIEINQGQFDANLGGDIYKKRISHKNRSKRDGLRTIIALKLNEKAFFIYGYAKNRKSNITDEEKDTLKDLAKICLNYDEDQIIQAININQLVEI